MDRPVGTSKRYTLGFERIALNCAACHVGTYRESAQSKPVPVAGHAGASTRSRRVHAIPDAMRARRAVQPVAGGPGGRARRSALLAAPAPAARIRRGAGDEGSADPGALPLPLSRPRGDAGSGPVRHVRPGEGAAELAAGKGAAGAIDGDRRFPVAVAARAARRQGHAPALGRQQRQRRGAQPQRRLRHRRGADPARPPIAEIHRQLAALRRQSAAEIPVRDRQGSRRARQAALCRVLRRLPRRRRPRFHRRTRRPGRADQPKSAPTRAGSTTTRTI